MIRTWQLQEAKNKLSQVVEDAVNSGPQIITKRVVEVAIVLFFAEYQNEPLPEDDVASEELTADQVAGKLNRLGRGVIPIGVDHVTAFIDVQATMLFYVVAAWEDDFTGYVVDYGAYPDQRRPYFTLRDARRTLAAVTKSTGLEGSIYSGKMEIKEVGRR